MGTDNGVREERFDVAPASELSVSNVSGRTKVTAADTSEIAVRYTTRSSKFSENAQVEVTKIGNRVSVQTKPRGTGILNFSRSIGVEYDITVPRDCSVTLQAVSSTLKLEGTRGNTGIRTVSGDVEIADVAGDTSITTVSGDVKAHHLAGTLICRSTSGDAEVRASRLRRFSLNSVSGDFIVETPLTRDEQCNAKTISGDLQLLIPPSTGATVQLKSVSGSVSCDFPAEIIKAGRRHWQGRINGGGGNVEMNSISGDLRVGSSVATATDLPAAETSARHSDHPAHDAFADSPMDTGDGMGPSESDEQDEPSVADILSALERGEISVEDAMARIT
jgi:DUF4097 and DUF4098 domain-containing protein YvlB